LDTDEIHDLAVTAGKLGALAVETAKLDNLAVTAGKIGALAVETAKINNNAVNDTKLRDSAALTVIGRAVNSGGDPSDIQATVDDRVLSRAASALAFTQVSTGMIANDAIDDTKAGNRVPQFYRRQGGNATDWTTPGTSNYTPTAVRIQDGIAAVTINAGATSAILDVTFPVAFSQPPLVMISIEETVTTPIWWAYTVDGLATASGFRIVALRASDPGLNQTQNIVWFAIGPE
jgi:hypothetical protein